MMSDAIGEAKKAAKVFAAIKGTPTDTQIDDVSTAVSAVREAYNELEGLEKDGETLVEAQRLLEYPDVGRGEEPKEVVAKAKASDKAEE